MTGRRLRTGSPRHWPRYQRGITFLAVLLAVAILSVGLSAAATLWSTAAQRDREAELLFVGEAYRSAIAHYARSGSGAGGLPRELSDLIEDRRTPVVRRHLRKLYADPMTGQLDWELIRTPDGGILGLHSASKKAPIKRANFPAHEADFVDAECYCDWLFVFKPRTMRRLRRS
jgi:type II secretory pathway pseudopilin PulG